MPKNTTTMTDQEVWIYDLAKRTNQRIMDITTVFDLMKNQEKAEKLILAAEAVGVNAVSVAQVLIRMEGGPR